MPLPLSRTLTAGTNENINDVQLNFNDLANAFPVQAANIGDGQITTAKLASAAVSPKKMLTVAHVSAVTSYTFSSLNGNSDYGYELICMGACNASATTFITVKPNSTGTNQTVVRHGADSSTTHTLDTFAVTGMYLAQHHLSAYTTNFKAQVQAKTGLGSHRQVLSLSETTRDSDGFMYNFSATNRWAETTTNITSLVIDFGGASFTGMLTLRKLGEV